MTYDEIKTKSIESFVAYRRFRDKLYDEKFNKECDYNEFLYELHNSVEYKEFQKWDALERLNRVPTMRKASEFDLSCRMTLQEFLEEVNCGCICDYDGDGSYGTRNKVSDIGVSIDQMKNGQYRKDFTHIYWYNK